MIFKSHFVDFNHEVVECLLLDTVKMLRPAETEVMGSFCLREKKQI